MLTRLSLLSCIIASVALLYTFDYCFWHVPASDTFDLPHVFAFEFGVALSLLTVIFAIGGLIQTGRTKFTIGICTWSLLDCLAFTFLYEYPRFAA
jgi:hypothetical protein